jgi:hypothetical protein
MNDKPCIFNDDDMLLQSNTFYGNECNMFKLRQKENWNNENEFYVINPIIKSEFTNLTERKNEKVSIMKNFLFESDTLSLPDQKKLVKENISIISMATYSGNKSIHFIIQISDIPKNIQEYHYVWKLLKDTYFQNADTQCNDVIRFSRTPNAMRNDTNKKQILLWNTLQPLNFVWRPLYNRLQEMKEMSMAYRKTIPITRNENLSYEAECILQGEYPKGERDAIINKGIPYLYFNGYSLNEILENNNSTRNNPQTIRNYYHKLETGYYA